MTAFFGLVALIFLACCATEKEVVPTPVSLSSEKYIEQFFDPLQEAAFANEHFLAKDVNRKLLARYSTDELSLIYADLLSLQESLFAGATKAPIYLATAGGPGAGKSTVLEGYMKNSEIQFVYADPDRAALLRMEKTYKADLAAKKRTPEEAYNHWRDASNFLANYFLAKALRNGYAVAHGTTMTAPAAVLEKIFATLKNVYGRKIHLLHITCNEAVREESEHARRARGVVQCTWEDFHNKNTAFFARLPQYLVADQVDFYYRSKLDNAACVASRSNGKTIVSNSEGFTAIQQLHEDNVKGSFAGLKKSA
jgi:hypothetical protein